MKMETAPHVKQLDTLVGPSSFPTASQKPPTAQALPHRYRKYRLISEAGTGSEPGHIESEALNRLRLHSEISINHHWLG